MNAPAVLYAFRWLIYDTFRQTLSSRVFWIMLACSAMCIVFCLGVSVEGGAKIDEGELIDPKTKKLISVEAKEPAGGVSLLFGLMNYTFNRQAEKEVYFLLGIFSSWVAGTVGILLALVWTAGFLPESLHPNAASVMLAKPVPRWVFLLGKYLGIVCFLALQASIFFLGTFLAIGLRTGVWHGEYLLGVPFLVFHFAMMYSFCVMLAVVFRSATACVVGGVLFWLICYAINYGRHFAVVFPDLPGGYPLPAGTVFLSELGYWILPKPADFTLLMEKSLQLGDFKLTLESQEPFKSVLSEGNRLFHPVLIVLSSFGFSVFALWTSAAHLSKTDY